MDLWNPLTQLEAVLYRRNLEKYPTAFEFHNHILVGCNLRYIQHPLKHKEVGRYRLVLVQGTRKGRLVGIKLHSKSELQMVILTSEAEINMHPSRYLINVSGTDCKGGEQSWQIALTSESEQNLWFESLKKARDSCDISEASGEAEKLRDLARLMKDGIDVRKRFSRFKFYNRSFEGMKAVKWLMREKQCTISQALAIGNKMLNFGLFSHVTSEHLFCAKNLLYRFSVEIDPLNALKFDQDDGENEEMMEEQGIESMLLSEISNDTNQLLTSYHRVVKEVKELQSLLEASHKKYDGAAQKYNTLLTKHRKQTRSIKKLDWFLLVFIVIGCGYLGFRHYLAMSSSGMSMMSAIGAEMYRHDVIAVTTVMVALLLMNTIFKRGLIGLLLYSPIVDDSIKVSPLSKPIVAGTSSVSKIDFDSYQLSGEDDDDDMYLSDHDEADEVDERQKLNPLKLARNVSDEVSGGEEDTSEDEDVEEYGNATLPLPGIKMPDNATRSSSNSQPSTPSVNSSSTSTPMKKSPRLSLLRRRPTSTEATRALIRSRSWQVAASLDHPDKWPNNPILIKRSISMLQSFQGNPIAMMKGTLGGESYRQLLLRPIHIHKNGPPELSVVPIESDLFVGNVYFAIANLPDSPNEYFRNKKRKVQYVVQGRFKHATSFASVYTGQAYSQPLSQLPAKWLLRAVVKILAKFQPALQLSLTGEKPFIITPLVSTAQNIVVSKPGYEPKIHLLDIEEDLSLLNPSFTNMAPKKRKQLFARRSNLQNYNFDPDLVYTFDMYQHMVNFSTFQIDFGFLKYDLLKPLGINPIQMMAVVWDPIADNNIPPEQWQYLYNFEVYHRRSIPAELLLPPLPASGGSGSTPRRDNVED